MNDREKVIKAWECCKNPFDRICEKCPFEKECCHDGIPDFVVAKAVDLLKEQGKKQITLQKKHAITWGRSDDFSIRKLYEAICETLLDEGELFIERTDDHEKCRFVFYVTEGR